MGDQLLPALGARIGHRRRHQTEVAPAIGVGADVEDAARRPGPVIHRVLVVLLPRQQEIPGAGRLAGRQVAVFRRGEAAAGGEQQAPAARAPHAETKQLVGLLVQQRVLGDRRAQSVAEQPVRPLGGVLQDVEDRGRVGRPGDRRDLVDALGLQLARHEILHAQRVLAEARVVDAVGQPPPVVAHRIGAQRQKRMPLGQRVEVQGDLFRRLRRPLATMNRVLLPRLRPRVVQPPPEDVRNALIILLDPRQHLLVQRLLKLHGRLHDRIRVRVLRLQIRRHLRTVLVPKPRVVVLPPLTVQLDDRSEPSSRPAAQPRVTS